VDDGRQAALLVKEKGGEEAEGAAPDLLGVLIDTGIDATAVEHAESGEADILGHAQAEPGKKGRKLLVIREDGVGAVGAQPSLKAVGGRGLVIGRELKRGNVTRGVLPHPCEEVAGGEEGGGSLGDGEADAAVAFFPRAVEGKGSVADLVAGHEMDAGHEDGVAKPDNGKLLPRETGPVEAVGAVGRNEDAANVADAKDLGETSGGHLGGEDKLGEAEAGVFRLGGGAAPVEVEFVESAQAGGLRPAIDPREFGPHRAFLAAALPVGREGGEHGVWPIAEFASEGAHLFLPREGDARVVAQGARDGAVTDPEPAGEVADRNALDRRAFVRR